MANEYDDLLLGEAPAAGNEYIALLGERQQQDSQALKTALHGAAQIDPEQRARAAALAERARLPVEVVERNLDLVDRQVKQQSTDYDALLTRYEQLSQWMLEDPTNAALAQDDLEPLQRLHDALTTGKAAPIGSAYDRQSWAARNLVTPTQRGLSLLQGGTSMGAAANLLDRLTLLDQMEPLLQAGDMQAVMALVPDMDPDPLFNLYWNAHADDPTKRAEIRQRYEQQLAQLLASAGEAASTQQALPQNPRLTAALESGSALQMLRTVLDEPGIIWQVGVESAVASIPGLLAMPLAGPGALGLNSLALEYGNTLMEGLAEQGVDVTDEAAVLAVLRDPEQRAALQRTAAAKGLPVGLFDTVSAGIAGRILAPQMLAGRELSATTRELVNIGVQLPVQATLGATGEAAGQLLAKGEINAAEVLLEGIAEVFGSGPEILSSRAAQAPLRSRMERLANARRTKAVMQTLGELAPAVKLGQRAPDRLQALVQRLGEHGGIADLLVPTTFWQEHYAAQGLDPREQAIAVLGDALAYDEAIATGTDLAIPLGRYVAKIAATPDHQAFIDHVRLDPLDPTNADADGWASALAEGIQEAAGADTALAQSVEQVRQDVLGQLTGIMPRDEAEQNAALLAARYRTRGLLRGMDPFELYSQHRLRIRAPVPEILQRRETRDHVDLLLDRLRAGDLPSQQDAFGQSLLEFLREHGLQDDGGELAARDIDVGRRPGQRRISRTDGLTLDHAAELAAEAGFLPERNLDLLLEAIDRELAGEPVFAPDQANQQALDLRLAMEELDRYLGQQGINLAEFDNAAIKQLLETGTLPAERPVSEAAQTYDQQGQLVTDSEAFRAWFGDSKVVDANGAPLVVYHGIPDARGLRETGVFQTPQERFAQFLVPEARAEIEAKRAYFFVDSRRTAQTYADPQRVVDLQGAEPDVLPVYLRLENPMELDWGGRRWQGTQQAIENAKAAGHDGVIIRNVIDDYQGAGAPATVYVAFDPHQIKSATDNRGSFDPASPSIYHQFAGEQAATADQYALGAAEEYLAAGVDPEQVRQTTGWFRGMDGKWRFEIDDSDATLNTELLKNLAGGGWEAQAFESVSYRQREDGRWDINMYPESVQRLEDIVRLKGLTEEMLGEFLPADIVERMRRGDGEEDLIGANLSAARRLQQPFTFTGFNVLPLSEVLEHPRLFAAYPALRDVMVQVDPQLGRGGSFGRRGAAQVITLGIGRQLSTLLHEIQHGIQFIEGFAIGGSPDRIQRAASQTRDTALEHMQALQRMRTELVEQPPADLSPDDLAATLASLDQQIADARSEAIEATGETNPEGAFQTYRRLAGEIEARNTEARRALTEDERRGLAPEDTQDIPSSEAIVVFNGQEAASAPPPANATPDSPRVLFQNAIPLEDEIAALRARVAELESELRTSAKTGLRNGRAFEEDAALGWPVVAALDMDGLKRLNSAVGHSGADGVLEALGGVLLASEVEGARFYHLSGDEFAARFADPIAGEQLMQQLQERLDSIDVLIDTEDADGTTRQWIYEGIGVSYGLAENYEQADARAELDKRARLLAGQREDARGDESRPPRRLRELAAGQDQVGAAGEPSQLNLFQRSQRRIARGSITFGADGTTIALLQDANLSTFLHESGHLFLEELAEDAAIPGIAATVQQDLATVQAWWQQQAQHILSIMPAALRAEVDAAGGVALIQQVAERWRAPQSPLEQRIVTELHEYWARGFEAYLRGEDTAAFAIAPSAELRAAFARFRAWLVALYQALTELRVNLTPEVRGVMDRLLATEQEIAAAEAEGEIAALFTDAETAGMSEAEFASYRATVAEASLKAREALQRKLIAQYQREQAQWWKDARAAIRNRVEQELNDRPEYRALAWLTTGKEPDGEPLPGGLEPFKLDKAAIVASHGAAFLRQLPGPRNASHRSAYVYAREGGVHPDLAAERLGFASGDALLDALATLQPKQALLEAETDARMVEAHGDLRFDGTLTDAARAAVHGDERSRVVLAELQALRRKQREVSPFVRAERQQQTQARRDGVEQIRAALPSLAVVRQMADGRIGQSRLRDLQPHRYLQAARRAGRDALTAVARGDWQAAALAKRRELVDTELYLAALRAQERRDKMVKHLKGLAKPTARTRVGKGGIAYLEQLDALLDRFEFARVPLKQLDERQTLLAWYQEQLAAGYEPAIDPALFNEASRRNYQELTLDELTGVYDAARSIETLARRSRQLKAGDKLVEREQVIAELVSQAAEARKRRKPPKEDILKGWLERTADRLGEFDADMLPVETLVEWLDGGATGPWHDYLFNPASEAQTAELDLHAQVGEKIGTLIDDLLKRDSVRMTDTFQSSLRPDQPFSRFGVISLALNIGNESNFDKMLRGFGWQGREAEVLELLGRLDASDLAFVQQVWDTIETLWQPLNELQQRVAGVPLDKVERRPVTLTLRSGETVELAGGYYPLVYDPRHSEAGQKQESGPLAGLVEEGYARATSPSSHRKGRTRFAAPLLLDFNQVLQKHMAGVIKDLTHREFLIDANWLLQNQQIRAALQTHLGDRYERLFMPWLKGIANDRIASAGDALTGFDRAAEGARSRVTLVALGWKATTMLAQLGGVPNVVEYIRAEYGSRYFLDAINRTARNPLESYRFVVGRSGEMRHRFQTIDRDIRDELRRIKAGKAGILQRKIERSAFLGINIVDRMVTIPAWLAAYRGALAQGATEAQAIHAGDAAVRRTQGAGGAKDLNALQRKRGVMRLLTMFLTPFAAQYGRLRSAGDLVGQRGARYAPELVMRAALITMLPAVISELLANRGPECEPGDTACWAKWTAVTSASSLATPVPVLRDIANGLEAYVLDGSLREARFSPVLDAINRLTRTAIQAGEATVGEDDWSDEQAFDLLEMSGYLLRLPTGQARITLEYLWDLTSGETEPDGPGDIIHGLLYRRPRNEQ